MENREREAMMESIARGLHQAWRDKMAGEGYSYGPEFDWERKTHPDMRPYALLTGQAKSYYRQAAREAIAEAKGHNRLPEYGEQPAPEAASERKVAYYKGRRGDTCIYLATIGKADNGENAVVAYYCEAEDKYHVQTTGTCSDDDLARYFQEITMEQFVTGASRVEFEIRLLCGTAYDTCE